MFHRDLNDTMRTGIGCKRLMRVMHACASIDPNPQEKRALPFFSAKIHKQKPNIRVLDDIPKGFIHTVAIVVREYQLARSSHAHKARRTSFERTISAFMGSTCKKEKRAGVNEIAKLIIDFRRFDHVNDAVGDRPAAISILKLAVSIMKHCHLIPPIFGSRYISASIDFVSIPP